MKKRSIVSGQCTGLILLKHKIACTLSFFTPAPLFVFLRCPKSEATHFCLLQKTIGSRHLWSDLKVRYIHGWSYTENLTRCPSPDRCGGGLKWSKWDRVARCILTPCPPFVLMPEVAILMWMATSVGQALLIHLLQPSKQLEWQTGNTLEWEFIPKQVAFFFFVSTFPPLEQPWAARQMYLLGGPAQVAWGHCGPCPNGPSAQAQRHPIVSVKSQI